VTGGTNAGVMALVGEAVSKYKQDAGAKNSAIVCIGIATWGAIENRAVLESKVIWQEFVLCLHNNCN
jgi:hypothetical protein